MAPEQPGIDGSRDIDDLHHLQLMTLLHGLVRDLGVRRAARKLDVDHRTLSAGLRIGHLSRRLRLSLEKALLERVEGQVENLGQEMRDGLGEFHGEVEALKNGQAEVMRRLARLEADGDVGVRVGESMGDGAGESGSGGQPQGKPVPRREYPNLATLEPAPDDAEVFGAAWPLIQEWRELKETHPDRGGGIDWLLVEERFMTVELALLEQHGLTLPPETYPLKGLDRGGQVNWRRKALADTRRVRRRLELLRRLRSVFTREFWRRLARRRGR